MSAIIRVSVHISNPVRILSLIRLHTACPETEGTGESLQDSEFVFVECGEGGTASYDRQETSAESPGIPEAHMVLS